MGETMTRRSNRSEALRAPMFTIARRQPLSTYSAGGLLASAGPNAHEHNKSRRFIQERGAPVLRPARELLDGFGSGVNTRGIVIVDATVCRAFESELEYMQESHDVFGEPDEEAVDIRACCVRLSKHHGEFIALIPLATLSTVVWCGRSAYYKATENLIRYDDIERMIEQSESMVEPVLTVTRHGMTLDPYESIRVDGGVSR